MKFKKLFALVFIAMLLIIFSFSPIRIYAIGEIATPLSRTGLSVYIVDPLLAIDSNDIPYVAYRDGDNGGKVTVMKYENNTWEVVGTAGFSSSYIFYPSLAFDSNDIPYVAYAEFQPNEYMTRTTVMKFNGNTWEVVGTSGFSAGYAELQSLAFDSNDIPYVSYTDGGIPIVMKWNGNTWEVVGTGMPITYAQFMSFVIDSNDIPYVAYSDEVNGGKITVVKLNGNTWEVVGIAGFSARPNKGVTIKIDSNNVPYLAYIDEMENFYWKTSIVKWNGIAWENVEMYELPEFFTFNRFGFDLNDNLYLTYIDVNYGKNTVVKLNGNSWEIVANNESLPFNSNVYSHAFDSSNILYLAYTNWNIDHHEATVVKFTSDPIVNEYTGNFTEPYENDGSVQGSRIITLYSGVFVNTGDVLTEGVHYLLENVPIGLTPVMSIDELGQTATLTFTGNAVNHNDENDVDNLTITFLDGAFTNTMIASDVGNYANNNGVINFLTKTFQGTTILYGADGAGSNEDGTNLYTLDPGTGEVTDIIGLTGYNINGMDFDPTSGILYGVTSNTDPDGNTSKSLFTIDPETGIATLKGLINIGFADIAFRSDGRLYARSNWEEDNYYLYTIDKTCPDGNCTLTLVGEGQSDIGSGGGGGIAFDSHDNLYLFDIETVGFFKVNPDTAEVLQQILYTNNSLNDQPITSAKFDGNDFLFATRSNWGRDTDLVMIDVTTGEITSMGGKNPDIDYMTALAFYLDPEDTCSDGILNQDETGIDTGGICTPTSQKRKSTGSSASVMVSFQQEQLQRAVDSGLTSTTPSTPGTTPLNLTRTLKYGMQGDDVKALQVYLNVHNYPVSLTGAGSLGNETNYFGLKTKQAVIRFQLANGLVGDGIVGKLTIDKLK